MRYRSRNRFKLFLCFVVLVFALPFLTAVPLIAGIAVLHHHWWESIPLMGYWTGYWFGVLAIGLGGPVLFIGQAAGSWALEFLD